MFVASGKPSGSPSLVVVFLFAEILIPDWSVYVVGLKALMLFVVSDWDSYWLHIDIQLEVL